MTKPILRFTALIEGVSWLSLLFIAMPIKYLAENPLPVKYIGMIHGILFVLLVFLILEAMQKKMINKKFGLKLFIASLIPFGTFFTDKTLKK